jgi:hypothetical protein
MQLHGTCATLNMVAHVETHFRLRGRLVKTIKKTLVRIRNGDFPTPQHQRVFSYDVIKRHRGRRLCEEQKDTQWRQ